MKKKKKVKLVSSHIDLSGFFFFFFFFLLKTVAKLGRSRKTNLGKILPKDFGKQHFSAEAVVTSARGWSSRAVKRRERRNSSMFLVTAENQLLSYHSSKGF